MKISDRPRAFFFFVSLALVGSATSARAVGRHPARQANEVGTETIEWKKADGSQTLEARTFGADPYLSIEDLARLATAQLRWQSISEQVCLSRSKGLVCFNWGRNQIYLNGEKTRGDVPLKFREGQLYVPIRFVPTEDFENFSGQEFYWNAQAKRLTQEEPVTISIPAVENLGDRYQLALDVKKGVPYHMLEKTPERIWIRFVHGQTEGSQILEGDSVITKIQVNQKKKSADLLIYLGSKATRSDVYFDQGTGKLTVDVFHNGNVAEAPSSPEPEETPAAPVHESPTKVVSVSAAVPVAPVPVPAVRKPAFAAPKPTPRVFAAPATDSKVWTIVIDAGHGGIDAGAIGVRGTFEKDVNLRTAKQLAESFSRNRNIRVILTRDRDEFLTLSERTEIANKAKADLFVSIHSNSSLSVKSTGFEVYILSPEATDQAAESVARIENSVVSLETHDSGSSKLNNLLASMAIYTFINESSKAAALVCRGVRKRSSIEQTSVKEANFHVLRGAQMPGILVELGYLSNPISELELRSSRYTDHVSKGISDGLLQYQQTFNGRRHSIVIQPEKPVRKVQR
jgi:N-acetylmuramoyl-L-alanine amidase